MIKRRLTIKTMEPRHSLLRSSRSRLYIGAISASRDARSEGTLGRNGLALDESTPRLSYRAWRDEYIEIHTMNKLASSPPVSLTSLAPSGMIASMMVLVAGAAMYSMKYITYLRGPKLVTAPKEEPLLITAPALDKNAEKIMALQNKLDAMRFEILQLTDQLREAQGNAHAWKDRLKTSESDVSTFRDGFKKLQSERKMIDEKIHDLETSLWKKEQESQKVNCKRILHI
jgi:hypothetical protein